MDTCWVLLKHAESDGSGKAEVLRVYVNQDRANEDFDLISNSGSVWKYELIDTTMYE
jgi:hypothetical protein